MAAADRTGTPAADARRYSHDYIQELVDRAASFNVFAIPDGSEPGEAGRAAAARPAEIQSRHTLHQFDIELALPSRSGGVRASNALADGVGSLDLRLLVMPEEYRARADREPPLTTLDPDRSQRFVIQGGSFSFAGDGFRSFGAGRTFPVVVAGRPKLLAAAVGNITEGFGAFRDVVGNYTMCGELQRQRGFLGHLMIRLLDHDRRFQLQEQLPRLEGPGEADSSATYLTWIAQKAPGGTQENTVSLTPRGQVRGLNIPVDLKRVSAAFTTHNGFRVQPLKIGEVIGLEIGFGRESVPRTSISGTPQTPFQFEGVSEYAFYDRDGSTVGTVTANVLEGRSIAVRLPDAPEEPALRFGFFGAIVDGRGCFKGARGMLYGMAGSVFAPPPHDHVITNHYVARLDDPEHRFRIR